ncbi:uncharacterized protein LOC144108081 [Amblyomma americanum]
MAAAIPGRHWPSPLPVLSGSGPAGLPDLGSAQEAPVMCMCETVTEIAMLAISCYAWNTISLLVVLKMGLNTFTILGGVFFGASAVASLILLQGSRSRNKGLVEKFILFGKLRVLVLAIVAVLSAFGMISEHKLYQRGRRLLELYVLQYARLPVV